MPYYLFHTDGTVGGPSNNAMFDYANSGDVLYVYENAGDLKEPHWYVRTSNEYNPDKQKPLWNELTLEEVSAELQLRVVLLGDV